MRLKLDRFWSWSATIDPLAYVLIGLGAFAIKFAIDWSIAHFAFGLHWSPINYLVWPSSDAFDVLTLSSPFQRLSFTLLLTSLPFIWIGVILTWQRLRSAGLPYWLILFFFVPIANMMLFVALACAPPRPKPEQTLLPVTAGVVGGIGRRLMLDTYWRSGAVALATTVPLAMLLVVLSTQLLGSYGLALFVGAPFAIGLFSAQIAGFSRPRTFLQCLLTGQLCLALVGIGIIAIAVEGAICVFMAAPFASLLTLLGTLLGHAIQSRPWMGQASKHTLLALAVFVPLLMAAEAASPPVPAVRAVATEVIIQASPQQVWPHVIAFAPLPEPTEWFFRTGIAYPQRAEIDGHGPGATRRCIFSTGTFVEPIEVWDEPTLLRFKVTEQPPPMEELSPFDVHPPHLDNYLCSQQGEFLLQQLSDGSTRLIGTTWYSNRMWPEWYWGLWSDYIIHRVHLRVLEHIERLAEDSIK